MLDGMPFHPIANEYPLLDEDELAELAEHIAENGQLIRVCMLDGLIIDGRNRWLACQRLGIECNTFDYQGDRDENALRRYIAGLNEHRRHLTPQWLSDHRKQRVERIAAARRDGYSIRVIAETENISRSQVERDIGLATVPGDGTVEPKDGTVTGKDGRRRTATPKKPAAKKAASKKPTPEQHEQQQHEAGEVMLAAYAAGTIPAEVTIDLNHGQVKDDLGTVLPSHLADVFADGKLTAELTKVRQWRQVCETAGMIRRLEALAPYNPYLRAKRAEIHDQLSAVYEALESVELALTHSTPCAVCPRCDGAADGCGHCDHAGWVPRWQYDRLTDHATLEAE